jgi:pimeloyl-ACP methyl ester carboxylesterase
MAALRQATLACLTKYGDRVRFYTSSVAVGDLEQVRRALGFRQIDLYGASYGTRVAELYMRRYPDRVHAVILDGVTYPQQAIGPDTPLDGEQALNLIVARCRQAPDCAAAYPDLDQELHELRQRFGSEKSSLTLTDPSTGLPLEIEFNRAMLSAALRFLSYSATEASLLPTLIHQAALGRLAPLAAQTIMMARQIGDQLASGMQNSVICSEDVPYFSAGSIDRLRIAQTYQGTDQLDGLAEICKLWPRGPVDSDLHSALESRIPTLLLSGEADPVTPPGDAERLEPGLERHRHLILSGEGHGQVATGCVPKLMAEFLDAADPQGLDATCLGQHHPAPFFVGLTGPAP